MQQVIKSIRVESAAAAVEMRIVHESVFHKLLFRATTRLAARLFVKSWKGASLYKLTKGLFCCVLFLFFLYFPSKLCFAVPGNAAADFLQQFSGLNSICCLVVFTTSFGHDLLETAGQAHLRTCTTRIFCQLALLHICSFCPFAVFIPDSHNSHVFSCVFCRGVFLGLTASEIVTLPLFCLPFSRNWPCLTHRSVHI